MYIHQQMIKKLLYLLKNYINMYILQKIINNYMPVLPF
jgi:hypothetical protein